MKLDVWEYVRLMVALEERAGSALLAREQEAWSELDQELTRLAESDHTAYSDLMLNSSVDLGALNPVERDEARAALAGVIEALKDQEKQADEELKAALTIERKSLAKRLKGL